MFRKKRTHSGPIKERVARHLRAADLLVKEGDYSNAVILIEAALELDPRNYYARSFLERARALVERAPKKKNQSEAPKESMAAREEHKIEQISHFLRAADQMIAAKNYRLAQQQVEKAFAIDPQNYYAQAYRERINRLQGKKGAQPPDPVKSVARVERTVRSDVEEWRPGERASVVMYRELLKEVWFDGKVTKQESNELKKVRDLFKITDEEHVELEKQIQVDAYVEALRIALKGGTINQNENDVLELMREKFNISMEEHMSAEAKILWAKSASDAESTIMLVDDDPTLLLSLATKLRRHGYDVATAKSVEEALASLEQSVPSIIVSDLFFGAGEQTGIEFYQQVRKDPNLENIPFLLMSGISDEFVVRAGMRMGVDNFIQKPFDLELLLATIEGKLKK